jgi:hypothetical protein
VGGHEPGSGLRLQERGRLGSRRGPVHRIDNLDTDTPPRYPTSIFVDPRDANQAWITYSGFNAKTPATPGHVFKVRFVPADGSQPATASFTSLDGGSFGDIPATSVVVTRGGTIHVGTDFGVAKLENERSSWRPAGEGLPRVTVADLVYVPERSAIYAGTHGQGVWKLKIRGRRGDDDHDHDNGAVRTGS